MAIYLLMHFPMVVLASFLSDAAFAGSILLALGDDYVLNGNTVE